MPNVTQVIATIKLGPPQGYPRRWIFIGVGRPRPRGLDEQGLTPPIFVCTSYVEYPSSARETGETGKRGGEKEPEENR